LKREVAKDPVCGMAVEERASKLKAYWGGKIYYFCSPGCQRDFLANPGRYAE